MIGRLSPRRSFLHKSNPQLRDFSNPMREITKAIENAPPLQPRTLPTLRGNYVQWETRLSSAAKKEKDNVRLSLDLMKEHHGYLHSPIIELLGARSATKGAPITVIGRISKV